MLPGLEGSDWDGLLGRSEESRGLPPVPPSLRGEGGSLPTMLRTPHWIQLFFRLKRDDVSDVMTGTSQALYDVVAHATSK